MSLPDTQGSKSANTVWHHATVTRARRERLNGHKSVILWFTGLSGSGKSTLAHALEERLFRLGCRTFVFDGDNVRHGLCGDLGFSTEDRVENIRRIGEMSKLIIEAGVIALTAFISPFRADRDRVRHLVAAGDFIEILCACPLEICEQRDVKGLYRRARAGEIPDSRALHRHSRRIAGELRRPSPGISSAARHSRSGAAFCRDGRRMTSGPAQRVGRGVVPWHTD